MGGVFLGTRAKATIGCNRTGVLLTQMLHGWSRSPDPSDVLSSEIPGGSGGPVQQQSNVQVQSGTAHSVGDCPVVGTSPGVADCPTLGVAICTEPLLTFRNVVNSGQSSPRQMGTSPSVADCPAKGTAPVSVVCPVQDGLKVRFKKSKLTTPTLPDCPQKGTGQEMAQSSVQGADCPSEGTVEEETLAARRERLKANVKNLPKPRPKLQQQPTKVKPWSEVSCDPDQIAKSVDAMCTMQGLEGWTPRMEGWVRGMLNKRCYCGTIGFHCCPTSVVLGEVRGLHPRAMQYAFQAAAVAQGIKGQRVELDEVRTVNAGDVPRLRAGSPSGLTVGSVSSGRAQSPSVVPSSRTSSTRSDGRSSESSLTSRSERESLESLPSWLKLDDELPVDPQGSRQEIAQVQPCGRATAM